MDLGSPGPARPLGVPDHGGFLWGNYSFGPSRAGVDVVPVSPWPAAGPGRVMEVRISR